VHKLGAYSSKEELIHVFRGRGGGKGGRSKPIMLICNQTIKAKHRDGAGDLTKLGEGKWVRRERKTVLLILPKGGPTASLSRVDVNPEGPTLEGSFTSRKV